MATLDSDDAWLPHHLAALWPHGDGAVLVAASALACGDDDDADAVWGVPGGDVREVRSPADLVPYLKLIVVSGAMLDREAVLRAGGFVPGMTRCADLDLWLRLLEHGPGRVTPDVTVLYSVHPGQVSDDRGAMRAAFREVVGAYRDRPWFSSRLERRFEGVLDWDDLRAALRERDWATAAAQEHGSPPTPAAPGALWASSAGGDACGRRRRDDAQWRHAGPQPDRAATVTGCVAR